ncbi:uncharacterized protein EAE97_000120 [Botrytis byssoidea]|uniref:Myb-like DNA-binding domain-containing protein n=1 Tax=Botrytis byssoidea TaxID=139641 RepID=A0A9P5IYQ2_9HELO|nr:uncharacterized protein EAE97_000120 [Botrytis byssoidea]KAF7954861.1 hypothetical protein EAE97_000120 [Botrytis byssoidea]
MPPKPDNPLTDREKCFAAVFNQLLSGATYPKLDYEKLAEDLGLPSAAAARTRWARMITMLKDGTFGDLKICSSARTKKRVLEEAAIEDGVEGSIDVAAPNKKHKPLFPRKKAGGAGRKPEKKIKEEKVMNGEGSGFDDPEDSDLV